jgi:ribosomal peptide maturation radical SAM protein 1
LGIVASVLKTAEIDVEIISAHIEFYAHLKKLGLLDPAEYLRISLLMEASEWVFTPDNDDDADVARILGNDYPLLRKIKDSTPKFMEDLAQKVVSMEPSMVGFTFTFAQSIASLELAKRIKALNPSIRILIGGPLLMNGIGEAIFRNYKCIDAFYHGDAETSLVDFLRGLDTPCITTRKAPATELSRVRRDLFVRPDHDEFFSRVASLGIEEILCDMKFPFETGRGCWWGFKHACTFCPEDIGSAPYRSKPWEDVVDEVVYQTKRHGVTWFFSVDSVMDYKDHRKMLTAFENLKLDLDIFLAVKSNITVEELILLKKAGARFLQPGIESLSTPVLRLMSKGVSAIQNLRFLKVSQWLDLKISWSIIVGMFGEDPKEYEKMVALTKNLYHLYPPADVTPYLLYRGSVIFNKPTEHGIRIMGPLPIYSHLYNLPEKEIRDIAYVFQYEYLDNRNVSEYTASLYASVKEWRRRYYKYPKYHDLLRYHVLGSRIVIIDERSDQKVRYELTEEESVLYRRGFDIAKDLDDAVTLEKFEKNGLVFRENGLFLSLAIPFGEP